MDSDGRSAFWQRVIGAYRRGQRRWPYREQDAAAPWGYGILGDALHHSSWREALGSQRRPDEQHCCRFYLRRVRVCRSMTQEPRQPSFVAFGFDYTSNSNWSDLPRLREGLHRLANALSASMVQHL